jgi:hypothetical protein
MAGGGGGTTYQPSFYWVDPADLSTQTAIDTATSFVYSGAVGFAHDPINEKIWLASNKKNYILRLDQYTHVIDSTITTLGLPSGLAYGDGYIWALNGSALEYSNFTPGVDNKSIITTLSAINPVTTVIEQTISDPSNLIGGAIRLAYDSTYHKIWILCDNLGAGEWGPRLVRVDTATFAVDGWCRLDIAYNMAITVAAGYVWIVDAPHGDPSLPVGGFTIIKINPNLVDNIGTNAIMARITKGAPVYEFNKNPPITITTHGNGIDGYVLASERVITASLGNVYMPTAPINGECHTISAGYADEYGYVTIYYWNVDIWSVLAKIITDFGSKTFVYSTDLTRWIEL